MKDISDQDLLIMVRNPQTRDAGFRILYDRFHRELYGYIRKIVITHENADDVLQNTLMKVFTKVDGFRGDASLKNWIYRIAHNEALQLLRKNKRQATLRAEEVEENSFCADPYFKGEEIHELLLAAVSSLPERQKQVFELKYFEEFKYNEIAEVMGVSTGALKASYHHAVHKITQFVKKNARVK